jgi:replicative superfamily II helicase
VVVPFDDSTNTRGLFKSRPKAKVVYIAPMKALVRERVDDWTRRLMNPTNRTLVELTGDTTPDSSSVRNADVIITTPEKWDSISRNWKFRKYVQQVGLIIMDEIHLLGGDRGPILEVIVSRMNFIAATRKEDVRIVGMSTAIANAQDLAGWLGVSETGLYNFKFPRALMELNLVPRYDRCSWRRISMDFPVEAGSVNEWQFEIVQHLWPSKLTPLTSPS